MGSASQRISTRSTTLRSSRTLPFHGCCRSSADRVRRQRARLPVVAPRSRGCAKWAARAGTSAGPLAQRRRADGDGVDAVVEVLAEAASGQQAVEVVVGRGDDPHVDLDHARAAHARDLPVLQHAQQLGLHGRGHVADLVQEQRAAVGLLEAAAPLRDGARERALLVAEQLALHELGGDRRAVHLDEGLRRAAATARGWRARPAPCRCRSRPG